MKNKHLDNYLRKALGEHFSYMPKGECKVNATKKMIEFTFNPAKVSKKFIEACTSKNQLYRYIKEATAKKVVMEFPIEESKADESMMTPTALTFTGKRTLQCDSEGKEILREEFEEAPDIERYYVAAYFDNKMRGLDDNLLTNDFEEVKNFVWKAIQEGSYIEVRDQLNGNYVVLNPDNYDFESDDLYRVLDDLEKLNSISESLTEATEEGTEDDEEFELKIDEEEEIEDTSSDDNSKYAELGRKTIYDSDGFMTDYTLYKDRETGRYICIFGDQDFYSPEDSDPDAEFEREAEAYEWFNSYEGIIDEDKEVEEDELIDDEELKLNLDEFEKELNGEEEVEEESLQLKTEAVNNELDATDIVIQLIEKFSDDVDYDDEKDIGKDKVKLIFNHRLKGEKLNKVEDFLESANVWYQITPNRIFVIAQEAPGYRDDSMDADRFENPESSYYNADLEEGLQLKTESQSSARGLDPVEEEEDITTTVEFEFTYNEETDEFTSNLTDLDIYSSDKHYLDTIDANDLTEDIWSRLPWPKGFDASFYRVAGSVEINYTYTYFSYTEPSGDDDFSYSTIYDDIEQEYHNTYYKFNDVKFIPLDAEGTPLKEDYWFGGDGKLDIPERDNIQPGDDEFELRIDDVTKDNEDQNTEEQEEELNEDYLPSEFYTVRFCRVDGDEDEIYEYKDLKDAEYHFGLFDDSDADLYSCITIEDPNGKIVKKKEFKSVEEGVEKEKKFSFKDKHICQGCGNPLSKCTCEVKEEELKEDATQSSNIGQHKMSSIDLIEETDSENKEDNNVEDSEMIKSLNKMVNGDKTTE